MLSKLKLYGELADFCGGQNQFEAVINQPIDAIRFLKANFAGLEQHMSKNFYRVYIGNFNIDEELLDFPSGGLDIKLVPVVSGAGKGGWMLGSLNVSALAGKIGVLLVLSGVAGLLTPTPELPDDEADPIKSFSFSGVQNTVRSGTAIPVIYGKMLVGSIPISTKIQTNDIEA